MKIEYLLILLLLNPKKNKDRHKVHGEFREMSFKSISIPRLLYLRNKMQAPLKAQGTFEP